MMIGIGLATLCALGIIGNGSLPDANPIQKTQAQAVQTEPVRKEVTETSFAPRNAEKENSAKEEKAVFEPATIESESGENVRGWKSLQCPKCQDGEDVLN
jgi:hypothetical protein